MPHTSRSRLIAPGEVGAGYPDAYPQPGIASIFPAYPEGAETPLEGIRSRAPDARLWHDAALQGALGIQMAIANPHIRALLGDLIEKAMRVSYKPVAQAPWVEKPYRAQYFGTRVVHDVAIAQSDNTWVTINDVGNSSKMEYTVPEGFMGVIKEFAQGVKDPAQWDQLNWRITIDGTPVAPVHQIGCQIATIENPKPLTIIVPGGSIVRLQVENPTATGASLNNMSGWLLGWFWPVANDGDVDNAQGQATVA